MAIRVRKNTFVNIDESIFSKLDVGAVNNYNEL